MWSLILHGQALNLARVWEKFKNSFEKREELFAKESKALLQTCKHNVGMLSWGLATGSVQHPGRWLCT